MITKFKIWGQKSVYIYIYIYIYIISYSYNHMKSAIFCSKSMIVILILYNQGRHALIICEGARVGGRGVVM